jgi:hypothetical protein
MLDGSISVDRYAYGIISLSIAMSLLLARYPPGIPVTVFLDYFYKLMDSFFSNSLRSFRSQSMIEIKTIQFHQVSLEVKLSHSAVCHEFGNFL